LSTKIHTMVDALGSPVGFHISDGEAHDLVGADHLLPTMRAEMLIANSSQSRSDQRLVAAHCRFY
jgi:hypothetical protein